MTPYDRRLQAARGFLELGLPLDANEELEQIEPEMRTLFLLQEARQRNHPTQEMALFFSRACR
jgi:hypothetical protein